MEYLLLKIEAKFGVESKFNENEICSLKMKRRSHFLGWGIVLAV